MFQTPFGGISLVFSLMLVLLGKGFFLMRDLIRMATGKRLGEIPMVRSSADIRASRRKRPSFPRRVLSYMIPFLFIALIGGNTTLLVLKLSHDEKRYTVFTPFEVMFANARTDEEPVSDVTGRPMKIRSVWGKRSPKEDVLRLTPPSGQLLGS